MGREEGEMRSVIWQKTSTDMKSICMPSTALYLVQYLIYRLLWYKGIMLARYIVKDWLNKINIL
jgi:hypothetical protein